MVPRENSWQVAYSVGRLAELACLLEVSAPKPGNVHRGADFDDVTFVDFVASAIAMGQAIDSVPRRSYGETVLAVARQTLAVADSNTNLGMNLLVTALAKAIQTQSQRPDRLTTELMSSFLSSVTLEDTEKVFEAIREMKPGGIGKVDDHDVQGEARVSLVEAMGLAADRDSVAAQFVTDFHQVINDVPEKILEGVRRFGDLTHGIVYAHVRLMAETADTLILRKSGREIALKSQMLSQKAIETLEVPTGSDATGSDAIDSDAKTRFLRAVSELDFWLRSDGRNRNPGTTADLIAAGIFAAAYNGLISPPFS